MPRMDPNAADRSALVAAGARLGARGLIVASEGNLSVRTTDGILITPSGRRKDALHTTDAILVPFVAETGSPAGGRGAALPSSDIAIHRAIYAARPDVGAIVHAHLAASLALTIVGILPDPADLPETARFLGRLPFVPLAEPDSRRLAAAVVAALTDRGPDGRLDLPNAVLLERHGAIAVGSDPVVAGDRIELVDLLCRVHRDVVLLRAVGQG